MPAQTVLIIDDEEPVRDAVHFILEEAGFAVLEASDGGAGLALLRASEVPLVVLLDLMMPGMSGIELLRAVAAEPALADRDAYIIFSAARAFSAPTLRFYLPGKRLFDLPKPFELDDLVAMVERAARQLDGERAGDDGTAVVGVPTQAMGAEDTSGGTRDGTT
ncbi:MAG TPA: response regulator [Ktedonobacterales bacterium]|nr:response regulator [Ktedonobacterales bacterium]